MARAGAGSRLWEGVKGFLVGHSGCLVGSKSLANNLRLTNKCFSYHIKMLSAAQASWAPGGSEKRERERRSRRWEGIKNSLVRACQQPQYVPAAPPPHSHSVCPAHTPSLCVVFVCKAKVMFHFHISHLSCLARAEDLCNYWTTPAVSLALPLNLCEILVFINESA